MTIVSGHIGVKRRIYADDTVYIIPSGAAICSWRDELELAVVRGGRPIREAVRGPALVVVVLVVLGLSGYWLAMRQAERLDAATGEARDQQALALAREHWDNPFLRLLTLHRVVIEYGSGSESCREVDIAAISFFGIALDRVHVACDDSVSGVGP
ncbi:MAG: hypothetical protein ABI598_06305 [Chloroflexota bacterium]